MAEYTFDKIEYGSNTYVVADTKNTAGSTDSSSKLFIVGATSQAANPQTYSHDTAYVNTNGSIYSEDMSTSDVDTFIDNLEVGGGGAITDAVVQQGTTGIWTYRKWSSGIAECWGYLETTASSYSGPYGNFYAYHVTANFPSGLFISRPIAMQNCTVSSGFAMPATNTNVSNTSYGCYALANLNGSQTCGFDIHAIGRWK